MINAVFFDLVGTLIRPRQPVGHQYAEVARRHGAEVDARALEAAFHRAMRATPGLGGEVLANHAAERRWWEQLVREVVTSCGAADLARPAYGFTRTKREGDDTEAVNKLFTPEFRNRLDAIISFGHLPKEVVAKVVDKFVLQLEAQLADRNVTIELSSAAKEWLAEKGYDPLYGARPLARVIQEHIKKPLAEELLFGKLAKGGAVKVGLKDGALTFDFIEAAPPALPKPEEGDGGEPEKEPEVAE